MSKEGAQPRRTTNRSFNHSQLEFLRKTIEEMVDQGLLYRNNEARWVAPCLVVPKPGKPDEYRLVVDLRWINHVTVPIQYPMPLIDENLWKAKKAKFFFNVDFLKGFWQVLVDEKSQEYFSFMTPFGVYTPTRLPMGATDSPLYFQAAMSNIFEELMTC